MKHIDYLKSLGACRGGIEMASKFASLSEAWEKCEHPPYMFWLLRSTKQITKEQAVDIAIKCAERVLPIWERKYHDDLRPRQVIEAAKAWLKEPSEENKQSTYIPYTTEVGFEAEAANSVNAAYSVISSDDKSFTYSATNAAYYAVWAACPNSDDPEASYASERKAQADIIRSVIGNPFTNL